jgi:uncharacterized protein YjbJ (UPF0337 family)
VSTFIANCNFYYSRLFGPRSAYSWAMNDSAKDKIDGTVHEAKGKVKQEAGKLLGNKHMQAEGVVENTLGKAQKKVGDVEAELEK